MLKTWQAKHGQELGKLWEKYGNIQNAPGFFLIHLILRQEFAMPKTHQLFNIVFTNINWVKAAQLSAGFPYNFQN